MRIAIVGGGISGLTAAYLLSPNHDITLFEANHYVGGHTNTIDVCIEGERQQVDTGFIVFNDRTYTNFCQLLEQLDVAGQDTEMSFSVRCERTGLEYRGADPNGLFAQRRNLVNLRFYRLLRDWLRFNRDAERLIDSDDESTTVADFFASSGYSRSFLDHYFLPMGSAVWSVPRERFEQFPIRFIAEFYANHGMLGIRTRPQWRVIRGGSRAYVQRMCERFSDAIRVDSTLESIERLPNRVELTLKGGMVESFDQVVFSCHSDQALDILGSNATVAEQDILSAFPYEKNIAVLHTDTSILPQTRRAWASWNYFVPRSDPGKATVTYNMNILQGLQSDRTYCVTLNGDDRIADEKVLRRIVYHHPIFDVRRSVAQRRHPELLGPNRTFFCGAYWGNGFHEDGVNSALAACQAIGVQEPWKAAYTKAPSITSDNSRLSTALTTASS